MEKVESSLKNVEKEVQEKAQDIKDELVGKVESTAQEVQHLRQDVKNLSGKLSSLRGGQLVDFFLYLFYW